MLIGYKIFRLVQMLIRINGTQELVSIPHRYQYMFFL